MPKPQGRSIAHAQGAGENWAWVRVSSREQEQEGFSLPAQEDRIQQAAQRDGRQIDRVFRVSETASKAQTRTEFKEMVKDAKKAARSGRLRAIYIDRVDRILRNYEDLGTIEILGRDYGIQFFFVSPGIDISTTHGSMMLGILAGQAKYETAARVDHIKSSMLMRVQAGLFVGHAPFGFENYGKKLRRLIRTHEKNASTVRLIFELHSTGKYTIRGLIAELWRRGIHYTEATPRFNTSKMQHMLRDRSYIGEVRYNDKWYPGQQERLIDGQTWDRVQGFLGNRVYRTHRTTYGHKLITCGHCGMHIVGDPKDKVLGLSCTFSGSLTA